MQCVRASIAMVMWLYGCLCVGDCVWLMYCAQTLSRASCDFRDCSPAILVFPYQIWTRLLEGFPIDGIKWNSIGSQCSEYNVHHNCMADFGEYVRTSVGRHFSYSCVSWALADNVYLNSVTRLRRLRFRPCVFVFSYVCVLQVVCWRDGRSWWFFSSLFHQFVCGLFR